MALTSTQLAAAITANQTTFPVVLGTGAGFPAVGARPLSVGNPMQIDGEIMFCIAQPATNMVTVRGRGSDGTAAVAHDILANVYVSQLPGDFPLPASGGLTSMDVATDAPVSIGQDSTITVPAVNTTYNINKATAAAIILNAPSLAMNAVRVFFISTTAAAHVITATGLILDASGTVRNTATMTANRGCEVVFIAENGFWHGIGTTGVTFA